MKYLSSLQQKNFNGEICLLRVDLNIKSGESLDSNPRVLGILPTIEFLKKHKAKIVIVSHRGRPPKRIKNKELRNEEFSLKPFARILSRLFKKPVHFIDFRNNFRTLGDKSKKAPAGSIFLLENLRFLPGEDKNDRKLAERLASLGTFYVNEAFAFSHRKNASMVAITKFLPSYAGLLLEKEIKNLSSAMNPFDKAQGSRRVYRGVKKPKHPFVIILGGAKISDKIGLIKNFLNKADYFLIGGGIANTFIAAQNLPVGESLYEEEMIPTAKKFLKSKKIILPVDFMIFNRKMLDIGLKTTEKYEKIIKSAGTIIWNGPVGYIEDARFAKGSKAIAHAIARSHAFSVVGGGETTSILKAKSYKLKTNVFVSTGGGAMLEYLAGKRLPGIDALK